LFSLKAIRIGLRQADAVSGVIMKSALAVFIVLVPIAGVAYAQTTEGDRITGIELSTDPARAAEVERRAEEIAARQQETASGASGTSGTSVGSEPMPSPGLDKGPTSKKHEGGTDSHHGDGGSSGHQ
jgi:hypothetical protein